MGSALLHTTVSPDETPWLRQVLLPEHSVVFINTDSNETPVAKENETAKRLWSRRNLYEAKIVQKIVLFWVLRQ